MSRANIEVINEVDSGKIGQWNLCFQWVRYKYDDGSNSQMGYRFMYRRPNGNLQAALGQARIPSATDLFNLLGAASKAGWFVNCDANRNDLMEVTEFKEVTEVKEDEV